jgi:hypothetical protein
MVGPAPRRKRVEEPSDTVTKLDLVILMIQDLEKNMDLKFKMIDSELASVKEITEMSRRTLRGNNGNVGLVGTVDSLISRVSSNEAAFCDMSEKISILIEKIKEDEIMKRNSGGSKDVTDLIKEAVDDDHVVRWSTIRDKTLWPIIMLLILGLLALMSRGKLFP